MVRNQPPGPIQAHSLGAGRPVEPSTRPPAGTTVAGMSTEQLRHHVVVEATSDTERTMQPQRVPVNVYESTGALVIVAPLPAVTPHDVTVELRPRTVRL